MSYGTLRGHPRRSEPITTPVTSVVSTARATAPAASAPLAVYALVRRDRGLALCALALAVVATFVTGAVIGSDLRGCPRTISYETCVEEAG